MSSPNNRKRRRDYSRVSSSPSAKAKTRKLSTSGGASQNSNHGSSNRDRVDTKRRENLNMNIAVEQQGGHANLNSNSAAASTESNSNIELCRLTRTDIARICETDCDIFTSFLLHTNARALHNILSLQYHLQFEGIQCCHHDCAHLNTNGDFYICLCCVFYGCNDDSGAHLLAHCKQQQHCLYFSLAMQTIYCCRCGTFHRSPWTDVMISEKLQKAQKRLLSIASNGNGNGHQREIEIIDHSQLPLQLSKHKSKNKSKTSTSNIWRHFDFIRDNGQLGIRGALNLGNTCYMTTILQAFVHSTQLRNYFLSQSHSSVCTAARTCCVQCEIEKVFYDFYCGLNAYPVEITALIGALWKEKRYNLAGIEMQDSHEFLITLNTMLHKTTPKQYLNDTDDRLCRCIVHSTFRGLWLSELKCSKCQHVSSKVESFMEINLQPRKLLAMSSGKQQRNNETIMEALTDYMQSESMPEYKCGECGQKHSCHKNVRIHTLPPTLCLHLKRFESDEVTTAAAATTAAVVVSKDIGSRSYARSVSPAHHHHQQQLHHPNSQSTSTLHSNITKKKQSKIKSKQSKRGVDMDGAAAVADGQMHSNNSGKEFVKNKQYLQFPVDEALDLSAFIHDDRKQKRVNDKQYRLRSMIVHSGALSSGHYVCCIRKEENWYFCDDSRIELTSSEWVKTLNAYMLFYEAQ